MATTTVAAAGTALALYFYSRRQNCQAGDRSTGPTETHTGAHSAPRSFMEDLYFFAEGLRCALPSRAGCHCPLGGKKSTTTPPLTACLLPCDAPPASSPDRRYTYGETLGRWRTADLLIGLAYLCRKDLENHPVEEIARLGRPFARGLTGTARAEALAELARIERFFRYCSGLRERRPLHQRKYVHQVLRIRELIVAGWSGWLETCGGRCFHKLCGIQLHPTVCVPVSPLVTAPLSSMWTRTYGIVADVPPCMCRCPSPSGPLPCHLLPFPCMFSNDAYLISLLTALPLRS